MSKPMNKFRKNKTNRNHKKDSTKADNKTKTEKEFDSFRHEIYKLGLSEFDKRDRLDARVELAIKLGAKPKSWTKKHQTLGADNKIPKKPRKELVDPELKADLKRISNKKKPHKKSIKQNGKARKAN